MSQHTPFELTESDRKVYTAIANEAVLRNQHSFDPRNAIAAAEAYSILGHYELSQQLADIPKDADESLQRRSTIIRGRAEFWSAILKPTDKNTGTFQPTLALNTERDKNRLERALKNSPDIVVEDPSVTPISRAEGWLMAAFSAQALIRKIMPVMAVANKFYGENLDTALTQIKVIEEALATITDKKESIRKRNELDAPQQTVAKIKNFKESLGSTFVPESMKYMYAGYNALNKLNELINKGDQGVSEAQKLFITNAITAVGSTLLDCIDAIAIAFPDQFESSGASQLKSQLHRLGYLDPASPQISISSRIVRSIVGIDSLMVAEASNHLLVRNPALDRTNYK